MRDIVGLGDGMESDAMMMRRWRRCGSVGGGVLVTPRSLRPRTDSRDSNLEQRDSKFVRSFISSGRGMEGET